MEGLICLGIVAQGIADFRESASPIALQSQGPTLYGYSTATYVSQQNPQNQRLGVLVR